MPQSNDAKLVLHYAPRCRAFTALWLVEELGLDYRLEAFDLNTGRHKQPDFLELNPMGKVPVVVHDGRPISEIGAITVYLSDLHPEANLAPSPTAPERGEFLRWIFFGSGVMEPAMCEKFFKWTVPARSVAWGSFDDMTSTLEGALQRRPWMIGDAFTTADVVVGSLARFGTMFGAFSKEGTIADYVSRLVERPAFQRSQAIETSMSERFPLPA